MTLLQSYLKHTEVLKFVQRKNMFLSIKKYDWLKIAEHGKCVGISSLVLKITKTVTEMQVASYYSIYIHCTPIGTNYEPRINTKATAGRKRGKGAKSNGAQDF